MKTSNTDKRKYHVYGIVGMIGLFLMGAVFGYIINGSDHVNHSTMTQYQCHELANKIMNAANNGNPDLIEQLNKVYSENCLNRVFEEPKPQPKVEEKKLPETTCEAVEELLQKQLNNENSGDPSDHEYNAEVYYRMQTQGCEKNKEKYWKLRLRELDIAKAINMEQESKENPAPTCEKIEKTLRQQLSCTDLERHYCNENGHIRDAKIYANLSERGCLGNSEKYKELAKQELEIARALTDDRVSDPQEQDDAIQIVETYKRLQMQAEAERMIEKAKKLTNPAIDFIIQLEKIIEE